VRHFLTKSLIALSFAAAAPAVAWASSKTLASDPNAARTVAVVNDAVISNFDLEQRSRLLLVTSGQQPTAENLKQIRAQVMKTLVDEMLQTQEAFKFKVQVQQDEVDKQLARIAASNNMQVADIYKTLEASGVARSALQAQLRAEIAWQKLVQGRLAPRVVVSQDEVAEVLARTQANANKSQFLVSEIFIAADQPGEEAAAVKTAQNLRQQMMQGTPFSAIARQYSQAPSAGAAGDIGWVPDGQLDPALNAQLVKMRPGTISDPIPVEGGVYILALRQKQTAVGTKPSDADQPQDIPVGPAGPASVKVIAGPQAQIGLTRLLIALDAAASPAKQEAARQKAIALFRGANGCGAPLNQLVKSVGGIQTTDMGKLPYNDLQPEFKKILRETPNGRPTPPLRSSQGIEMFVVCSGGSKVEVTQAPGGPTRTAAPKTEAFKMPTKEDIENRIYSQQLNNAARRYLRDLRRDAIIEIREE
jgi:peptidyl-prolyl cis-trans isomerase SurA